MVEKIEDLDLPCVFEISERLRDLLHVYLFSYEDDLFFVELLGRCEEDFHFAEHFEVVFHIVFKLKLLRNISETRTLVLIKLPRTRLTKRAHTKEVRRAAAPIIIHNRIQMHRAQRRQLNLHQTTSFLFRNILISRLVLRSHVHMVIESKLRLADIYR